MRTEFPILYKRTVTNKISQWQIICEDNRYWSEYGDVGGAITKSEETICTPKNIGKVNETNEVEQAKLEAKSIFDRKINMENFVENIDDVDKIKFSPPMLAKIYDKIYKPSMKFIQPKLDGIRCNIFLKDGAIESISRRNKTFYTVEHIENKLVNFFERHPSIHLDGELYNHSLHDNFNKIVSLVKKKKLLYEDKQEIEKKLKYYVYDLWDDENPLMTFEERNSLINEELSGIDDIVIVPTYRISNADEIDTYFCTFIEDGYEGAIIRTNDPYEHKRSGNLLKYKEFLDEEFEIMSVNVGKSNTIAESFTVMLKDGQTCNATLAFSDDICFDILNNKDELIGKKATVKFFGYTNDGLLRFPVVISIDRNGYE